MISAVAEYVTYPSGEAVLIRSYLAVPAAVGPAPPILILRGVAGPDDGYIEIANRFCSKGFAALIHSWQVRGDDPSDALVLADSRAAVAYLESRADIARGQLGIVGYCRGGAHGVLVAGSGIKVDALVLVHGMSRRRSIDMEHPCHPIEIANRVQCPILILHGDDDEISTVGGMRELSAVLEKANAVEFASYPRARHGFAVRTHPGYLAEAAEIAHTRTIEFMAKALPTS